MRFSPVILSGDHRQWIPTVEKALGNQQLVAELAIEIVIADDQDGDPRVWLRGSFGSKDRFSEMRKKREQRASSDHADQNLGTNY